MATSPSPPSRPINCLPIPKVSIVGAGNVGSTLAQRIAEKNLANVVLLDVEPGRPQGIALDLMEARGIEQHDCEILGTDDYRDTANSAIVVITAGLPRKPGMTREDLMQTNARIVVETAKKAAVHSPEALVIVVTNPLDVVTYLAWKATGFPSHRVMGMAGILDSARLETFIAMELGVASTGVHAMVLGSHGDLMVPLPRYSTVNGVPITQLMDSEAIAHLVQRTREGGAEIVRLMQTGGAYYAPASSTYVMVDTILNNHARLLPLATYANGEYGLEDVFIGLPCYLNCQGVQSIVKLELTDAEYEALHRSAQSVKDNIQRAIALL
jgi:malate dehydrogenase